MEMEGLAGSECPGCGATLADTNDCDRCHYFELAANNGRYHYCGKASCFCRNLPGLQNMHREIRQRFIRQHEENVAAGTVSHGPNLGSAHA